jgi:hypothetical protein
MTAQPSMPANSREPRRTSKAVNLQPPLSIRYQRASSVLPGTSLLKRAMIDSDTRDPGGPPDPSDSEHSTTEPDESERRPSLNRNSRTSGCRGIRVTLVATTVAPVTHLILLTVNPLTSARISLPLNQSQITTVTLLPLKELNGLREGSIMLKWPS